MPPDTERIGSKIYMSPSRNNSSERKQNNRDDSASKNVIFSQFNSGLNSTDCT